MGSINFADPPTLDEIDERIVALLKKNGRATNQQIAQDLKIAAATVSARIRRLEQTRAVRVVAVTDFAALGYKALLALGIEVQGRAAEDVGIDLAALDEVFSVAPRDGCTRHRGPGRVTRPRRSAQFPARTADAHPRHPQRFDRDRGRRRQVQLRRGTHDMTTPVLDELDRRIIGVLSKDARVSNRRIAALLGVTEGTIRSRIKRLEQDNLIRLTAVTNVASVGAPKVVLIWIQAAHSEVKDLCDKLAAMPEIRSVIILLGRCDILAVGLFTSLEDVIAVANNRILALPGVRHVETSIAVKTLKYDIRAARITRDWHAPD